VQTVTRLHPATLAVSKQLLPVYDKPMVYYPLSTLMLAGIRDILLISTPQDTPRFAQLLGDGSQWGISIQYAVQPSPDGLAQAFTIGADFIGNHPSALVLGDNIFYGHDFQRLLSQADDRRIGATVFAYHVHDPERYGVAEFDAAGRVISLQEKPPQPRSNYAVTSSLRPWRAGDYRPEPPVPGARATGRANHGRQGLKVACPEEIAFHQGWIDGCALEKLARPLAKNGYGQYLLGLLGERVF
jgi:glucose-1-phosphate thymidylyltransferase